MTRGYYPDGYEGPVSGHGAASHMMARELYRPTDEEKRIAIETLLRSDLPTETRRVIRDLEQELAK